MASKTDGTLTPKSPKSTSLVPSPSASDGGGESKQPLLYSPSEIPPGSPFHRISTYKPYTPHRPQYSSGELMVTPPPNMYPEDLSPYIDSPPSGIVHTEENTADVATEALDIFNARESERNKEIELYESNQAQLNALLGEAGSQVGNAQELPEAQHKQELIDKMYRNRIMILGYNTMLESDVERIYKYWTQGNYIPDEFDSDLSQTANANEQKLWVRNIFKPLLYTPWRRSQIRASINTLTPNLQNSCVRRLKEWLYYVEEPFKSFLYDDRVALYYELIQGYTSDDAEETERAIEAAVEPETPENTRNRGYDKFWRTKYPVQGDWEPGTPKDLRRKHRFDRYNRHNNSESPHEPKTERRLYSVLKL